MLLDISGELEIDSEKVPFYFDGRKIKIRKDFKSFISHRFGVGVSEHYDIIIGTTDINRYIAFFGVTYLEGYSLSAQGWAMSSGNMSPDSLFDFDAIIFTGNPIDAFFTPKRAISYEKNVIINENEKAFDNTMLLDKIVPRSYVDYVREFNVTMDNELITVKLCVYTNYNLKRYERDIGTVTSELVVKFQNTMPIVTLPKYYLYILDLMKFISFRQNVSFDSIILCKKSDSDTIKGSLTRTANCEFFVREYKSKYKSDDRSVITYDNLGANISTFFKNVASRRLKGIVDDLYIPETNLDFEKISYASFLSCALSFEGEYCRCFPNEKANTSPIFMTVKSNIISGISTNNFDYSDLSAGSRKKAVSYHEKYEKAFSLIDSSLEEKFNNIKKRYSKIVSDFINKALSSEKVSLDNEKILGSALSEMRNHISHGNPIPIIDIHVVAYRITRAFIYVLILDEAEVPHDVIKTIVDRMF